MLIDKSLEELAGGNVFLNCGNLFAGNVFGDVATALAVLEVVVGVPVRIRADNGEVAAFHARNGGHFRDTFGYWSSLHTRRIYAYAYTFATKKSARPRNFQTLKKFVLHPAKERLQS
jgi:hypothetical protein